MDSEAAIKYPVVELIDPHFIVYVELVNEMMFIHMDVFRWNKTTKKRFLRVWTEWADANEEVFAMPFIDDEKMAKWVKMCGFRLLDNHRCTDGVIRKLYIRRV
jgi:hypothetical protein